MLRVKYVAPFLDHSGYGQASRDNILSLYRKGVEIKITPQCFEASPPPIANVEERKILEELSNKPLDYSFLIVHLTPDLYHYFIESGVYNIGYMAWETTKLHPRWVDSCNKMNEIWVPSEMNKQALKNSGVNVPVTVIPHGINNSSLEFANKEFHLDGIKEDAYKFYSIFQWTSRKNPIGLLYSYFNAFEPNENVVLILKTYKIGNSFEEREFIKNSIRNIKKDMGFSSFPPVYFLGDSLSTEDLMGLHLYGDCLVSLHKAEGFGLTLAEAGLTGNPVIGTAFGGNMEFMKPDNSYPVDYQLSYVSGMSSFNQWYLGNQTWAAPNLIQASKYMRYVYKHREEAKSRGAKLKSYITENFSLEKIADLMIKRLNEIQL